MKMAIVCCLKLDCADGESGTYNLRQAATGEWHWAGRDTDRRGIV